MNEYFSVFIFFFAVIDPIGTIPVFMTATQHFDEKMKQKIALQAIGVSALILLFFVIAGEYILFWIGIPLSAFQIAGGIVLFLFALTMVFGVSKPEEEIKMSLSSAETAVFPLAIPSIASPGAMLAAVLLTENNRFGIMEQLQTAGIMLLVLLIVLVLLLMATHIHRFIGISGASIISRIMGLILSSLAVANILEGITVYFALPSLSF